jgi:para-aminobenzoate synthetase/4-amino-4-deoxychorismate lyase
VSRRPDPAAGVFDTLLVQGGAPVALDDHLARLAASVRALYDVALDVGAMGGEVTAVAAGAPLQRVRIDVVPGDEPSVTATPLAARPRTPWHLVVRRLPGGWGDHKWRDRSGLDAPGDPSTDPLLIDEHDLLLETGRGNVFVVRDEAVATPPLDGRILPGITRADVLGILDRLGIDAVERPITLTELTEADEVFASGSISGVRPVATCDVAGPWPVGPLTRAVDDALERAWVADAED